MRTGSMRDCQAWRDEGLGLSTSSNEAAKLYDSCLTQFVSWKDDPASGGLASTCAQMYNADPNFLLGRAFNLGLNFLSMADTITSDADLKKEHETLSFFLNQQRPNNLTPREVLHLQAVLQWGEGRITEATRSWQSILLEYPTDIHALRMANDTYLFLGQFPQYRDNIARVLPIWESRRPPLKSYLYGLYAFGLEETSEYDKATMYAKKSLEENRFDGWATHTLAHVYEMKGRTSEGLRFMNNTMDDWDQVNFLARHNHWHMALFHLENEDWDAAISVMENKILPKATKGKTMFDLYDSASLLFRFQMLIPDANRRIPSSMVQATREVAKSLGHNHMSIFNDSHQMMPYINSTPEDSEMSDLLETLDSSTMEFVTSNSSIGRRLLQAFVEYRDSRYSEVVLLLEPIRYKLTSIGGSAAQRDVFELMLIISAMKSTKPEHRKLAKTLITERDARKDGATRLTSSLSNLLHGYRDY